MHPLRALVPNFFVLLPCLQLLSEPFNTLQSPFVLFHAKLFPIRTVTFRVMQILPKAFYSNTLTHIHFHSYNSKKRHDKQNIFETFQDVSSSENDLSDEGPEYQCSRSGDSSEFDDIDRSRSSSNAHKTKGTVKAIGKANSSSRPSRQDYTCIYFWRIFFFSTIITNTLKTM